MILYKNIQYVKYQRYKLELSGEEIEIYFKFLFTVF